MLGIDAARIPDRAELGLRPDHRRHPARQDQRPVGHRHQPGPLVDQPGHAPRRARAARLPRRAGHVRTPPRRRSSPHLVLPAAGWGEKEGTFINSERRIGLIKKVAARAGPGAGRLLTSSSSIADVLGLRRDVRAAGRSPEAVFQILKRALAPASRATSPASTTTRMLDERGGIQWPLPARRRRRAASERRLFADGRFYPRRRPGAVHLRGAARRCPSRRRRSYPAPAAHRPRHAQPVAHADAHRQVGRAAQALPARAVRRDQPGRRAQRSASRPTSGSSSSRSAARCARARSSRHACSPGRCSCRCTTTTRTA